MPPARSVCRSGWREVGGSIAPEFGVAMASGNRPKRWQPLAIVVTVIVLGLALTAPGRDVWQRFFSSLRIEKPKPVSVTIPGFSGNASTRRLQDAIGGMLADTTNVTLDEKDQPAATPEEASQLAGFAVQLPGKRTDAATLIVTGARTVAMTVNLAQLQTIYREAGNPSASLPPSLNDAKVAIRTAKAVQAKYGHCPVPVANTLQGQIQGPPPPSTDNGDCVVLTETPPVTADIPPGLDMQQLAAIGLELAGMSPNQRQAFQAIFNWQSAMAMPLPRFMRSYDSVTVNGAPGMLLNTAGRRGPTYELIWKQGAIAYSLVGYGSAADALPIASSMTETRKQP